MPSGRLLLVTLAFVSQCGPYKSYATTQAPRPLIKRRITIEDLDAKLSRLERLLEYQTKTQYAERMAIKAVNECHAKCDVLFPWPIDRDTANDKALVKASQECHQSCPNTPSTVPGGC